MNTTPPSPSTGVDPARRAALRGVLIDMVDESVSRAPARRKRALVRSVSIAAGVALIAGGGIAFAASRPTSAPGGGTAVAPPVSSSAPSQPSTQPPASSAPTTPGTVDPAGTPSSLPIESTPALDLADPSSWIISGSGWGPLTLGGPQTTEAAQMASSYTVSMPAYACPVNFYTAKSAAYPGVTTEAVANDEIDSIMIGDVGTSPATTAAMKSTSPKTAAGIGIGSTEAELVAAYPGIKVFSTSNGSPSGSYFDKTYSEPDGKGHWISFELDDRSQVAEINIGLTKTRLGEFC